MRKSLLSATISLLLYSCLATVNSNADTSSASQDSAAKIKEKEEDAQMQSVLNTIFKTVKNETLPLTPEQIDDVQNRLDETGAAIYPSPKPIMTNRTQNVSLAPGATAVSMRLAAGYVSSLVVIDSTGEPWPITTATVGNDKWFSVAKPETGANNMLTINSLKNHVSSNLAITLKGRDAPLIVELIMSDSSADKKQQEADMLVSMRMNQPGPLAAPPALGPKINSAISSELMSFLDGVAPAGAVIIKLRNEPEGVAAWKFNNQLYLRTPYLARWPAWFQQASSSSGTHVYIMPMESEVNLAVNGASRVVTVIQ